MYRTVFRVSFRRFARANLHEATNNLCINCFLKYITLFHFPLEFDSRRCIVVFCVLPFLLPFFGTFISKLGGNKISVVASNQISPDIPDIYSFVEEWMHQSDPIRWPLNYLFKSLFRLTSTKSSKVCVSGPSCGELPVDVPHKGC